MEYTDYLESRRHSVKSSGLKLKECSTMTKDFQRHLIEWSLDRGRAAIFADCGLGKTLMELTWAHNVMEQTGKPVLVITPLAVSAQTINEAHKFGIDANRSNGTDSPNGIVVTNYEKLHHFNASDYSGVVLDESSILKNFDGKRKAEITSFMMNIPYRLLATATAAPNDYTELGTSSEALGEMGHLDMLNKFFINDLNNIATKRMYGEMPKWRFKGHSETPFWRYVCSWARACRFPSDLGFSDDGYILPQLTELDHLVNTPAREGMLFDVPASTLPEQREEKKRTIEDRCKMVADLANTGKPVFICCHMNDEAKMLKSLIPDCIEVSGSTSDEAKERAFMGFVDGTHRVLITKPKIGAWGLNFQHCNHICYFPSHSFEQYYQTVRRCWRFGQNSEVNVDIVMTEGERKILLNLKNKQVKAEEMFANLVKEMANATTNIRQEREELVRSIPQWMQK